MNSPQEQQQIRQQAAEWAIRLDGERQQAGTLVA
ncbi:hypothetical protein K3Z96_29015, partial [Pseudomonas aeruginosa]|nr:hypothetical protein [Pseudomonas aeruginosa]